MDFAEFLKRQARIIDKRLKEVLDESSKKGGEADLKLSKLINEFANSSKDGKRIRGSLVLLGYQTVGGKGLGDILDAAVAFEIFQTAILAQDDVIDKSLTRRGKPSLYQALGGDARAVAQTICLSDIGFFTAFRLINTLNVEDALKIKALNLFSQTLTQTVLGEMLDIETPFYERDFQDSDSLKIALLKTARYTISGPLMLGAVLGGAKVEIVKELQVFGDNLGIAFQIQDDILGVFGDESIIGKSASSDIKECKATLLISYAQKKGDKEQREILGKYYGDKDISEDGVEEIRKVFKETGALEYANSQVERYLDKAKECLPVGKKSLKGAEEGLLYSLAEFLKNRVK